MLVLWLGPFLWLIIKVKTLPHNLWSSHKSSVSALTSSSSQVLTATWPVVNKETYAELTKQDSQEWCQDNCLFIYIYNVTRSFQMSLNSPPAYCATGKSSQWGSIWVFSDFCEIKVYKHSTLVCLHWYALKSWINMFKTHFIHLTRHQFCSF